MEMCLQFLAKVWNISLRELIFYLIFLKKKAEEEDKKGKVREILSESLEGFAERKIKELPVFLGRLGKRFYLNQVLKIKPLLLFFCFFLTGTLFSKVKSNFSQNYVILFSIRLLSFELTNILCILIRVISNII